MAEQPKLTDEQKGVYFRNAGKGLIACPFCGEEDGIDIAGFENYRLTRVCHACGQRWDEVLQVNRIEETPQ